MAKILYLHGVRVLPRGRKAQHLRSLGHTVQSPELPIPAQIPFRTPQNLAAGWKALGAWLKFLVDPSGFRSCTFRAGQALREFAPDIVVGMSLGGAVALNLGQKGLPLVLVAPAWNWYGLTLGKVRAAPSRTIVIHSRRDTVVRFKASQKLLQNAQLSPSEKRVAADIEAALNIRGYNVIQQRLIAIGKDHRCNEPDPNDTLNRDPDPLNALTHSIEILTGTS